MKNPQKITKVPQFVYLVFNVHFAITIMVNRHHSQLSHAQRPGPQVPGRPLSILYIRIRSETEQIHQTVYNSEYGSDLNDLCMLYL